MNGTAAQIQIPVAHQGQSLGLAQAGLTGEQSGRAVPNPAFQRIIQGLHGPLGHSTGGDIAQDAAHPHRCAALEGHIQLSLQLDAPAGAGQESALNPATGSLAEEFSEEMLAMFAAVGRDQVEHVQPDRLGLAVAQCLAPGRVHELDPAIDADQLNQITGVVEQVDK